MNGNIPRKIGGAVCATGAGLSLLVIFCVVMNVMLGGDSLSFPRFTNGTVISFENRITDATGRRMATPLYFPCISYRDSRGVERRFFSDYGSLERKFAEGERVRVVYCPRSKGGGEIVAPSTMWGATFWLGWALGVGAIVCILPFVIAAYAWLNDRRVRDVISHLRHVHPTA